METAGEWRWVINTWVYAAILTCYIKINHCWESVRWWISTHCHHCNHAFILCTIRCTQWVKRDILNRLIRRVSPLTSVELLCTTVFTVTLPLSLVSTATLWFLVQVTFVVNPIGLKEHTREREVSAKRGLPGLSRATVTVGTRTVERG